MHIVISYPALRNLCFVFRCYSLKAYMPYNIQRSMFSFCLRPLSSSSPKTAPDERAFLLFLKLSVSSLALNTPYTYHPTHTHRNIQYTFFNIRIYFGRLCPICIYKFSFLRFNDHEFSMV